MCCRIYLQPTPPSVTTDILRSKDLQTALRNDLDRRTKKLTSGRTRLQDALDSGKDRKAHLDSKSPCNYRFKCALFQDAEIEKQTVLAQELIDDADHTVSVKKQTPKKKGGDK